MKVRFSIPTFTPSRDSRCLMEEAVKALVKVPVKKEQRTRPVRIHSIPKKRLKGDLGTLSPYLREDIETDVSGYEGCMQSRESFSVNASSLPHTGVGVWGSALVDLCHLLNNN